VRGPIRQYGQDPAHHLHRRAHPAERLPAAGPPGQLARARQDRRPSCSPATCTGAPAHCCPCCAPRWIIENFLKYNAANYGIDTLADYAADLTGDTRLTANPAYQQAKKTEQAAQAALTSAQARLAAMLADPAIPASAKNATLIPGAQQNITACEHDLAAATARRKTLRAKIPRDQLHPGAQRAILHTGHRLLQLVLRLLAANAEQHLADHLNVYLHDDDEYRAITRETILRGLGGTITYTTRAITVTLDQPGQPRVTPRPRLPARRDQPQPAGHPRRPPAHHLPPRPHLIIINRSGRPNCRRSGPGWRTKEDWEVPGFWCTPSVLRL